uniref:Ig-like domain-containing protein n=1 Tax=Echeneis naucrates TaxID=173247 RepID=A0A665WCF1_ECHNA
VCFQGCFLCLDRKDSDNISTVVAQRDTSVMTDQSDCSHIVPSPSYDYIKGNHLQQKSSDTGMYYCIDTEKLDLKFLKGTFLRVKEPEITTNFQLPPSDPVRPGDSVTLQCSVLFDSEKKTCPGDHSVYWFRAGSDEAHPSFIYAHGNNRDHYHCKKSPESESTQKCDYFFSKNVSSSDAGTHYCAVATCGEILFGNGTKLEIEGKSGIFLYNCSNCLFLFLISGCSVFRSYLKQQPDLISICPLCNHLSSSLYTAADAATVSTDQRSQQVRYMRKDRTG